MFHFNIAPKLRERLDAIIPGGYNDAGWLLSYVPEPGLEKRIMVATKTEGHMSECDLLCTNIKFIYAFQSKLSQ